MDDRLDVDATQEQGAGEQDAANRVPDDDRDHRRSAGGARVEPTFAREPQEEVRQFVETCDALGLAVENGQCGQCGGRIGRREPHAVDESRCRVLEVLDELGGAGDVAAAAGERFGQRAHPDIDAGGSDCGVFAQAPPGPAQCSERMGLVDIEHRAMLFLDGDEMRQVGEVAIHAVDAFDRDQHAAMAVADSREEHVERAPVVVGESATGGPREPCALQYRIVGQYVVRDEVSRTQQVPNGRDVGRVPGDEDDRRRCAEKRRERVLEVTVNLLFTGDQATGARACSVAIDGGLGCRRDRRIAGHANIVVGAEVGQRLTVDVGEAGRRFVSAVSSPWSTRK